MTVMHGNSLTLHKGNYTESTPQRLEKNSNCCTRDRHWQRTTRNWTKTVRHTNAQLGFTHSIYSKSTHG